MNRQRKEKEDRQINKKKERETEMSKRQSKAK